MMKKKIVTKRKKWLTIAVVVAGLVLVLGGVVLWLWQKWPGDSSTSPQGQRFPQIPLPPALQRDTPERAMENFLQAYQNGDFAACREWMNEDLAGFYVLLGGLEKQWENQREYAGALQGWEIIRVYPANPEEAYYRGEYQILVRHIWERAKPDCVIYRLAPPPPGSGDHWRVGGVYMFNAPCE